MSNIDKELEGTKLIPKLIQIEMKDKKAIDNKAKELGVKSNLLIRTIIKNYLREDKK